MLLAFFLSLVVSIPGSFADSVGKGRKIRVCSCFVSSAGEIIHNRRIKNMRSLISNGAQNLNRPKIATRNTESRPCGPSPCQMKRRYQCHRLIQSSLFSELSSNQNILPNYETALCIVPPTTAWDRLQRARHQARDPSFHEWPPAIRLFHPFATRLATDSQDHMAFELANFIEELELESFNVTLDQWAILPNLEAIQAEYLASQSLPQTAEYDPNHSGSEAHQEIEGRNWNFEDGSCRGAHTDEEIQQLIESEERKGKERMLLRQRRLQARKKLRNEEHKQPAPTLNGGHPSWSSASAATHLSDDEQGTNRRSEEQGTGDESKLSPKQVLREQQLQYEEFNGPCILCLEPDATSRELLCDLRESLQDVLCIGSQSKLLSQFSPSSIYNWAIPRHSRKDDGNEMFDSQPYRPLIPISAFGSVTDAMAVARRLKGLWEPLTFPVTELHILSCREEDGNAEGPMNLDIPTMTASSSPPSSLSTTTAMESESSREPFGCNAKIKLFGEDLEELDGTSPTSDLSTADQIQLLLDKGEPGGMDLTFDYTILDDEEEPPSTVLEWLNDDADWDEGVHVVIGRTTFLTGDQRTYKGMPATSTFDAKDRLFGGGGGVTNGWSVSGAARRRTTVGRSTSSFQDGEFGHRESDWSPFSTRGRGKRKTKQEQDPYSETTWEEEAEEA